MKNPDYFPLKHQLACAAVTLIVFVAVLAAEIARTM